MQRAPGDRTWDAPTGTATKTIPEADSPFGSIKVEHGLNSNPAKDGSSYGEYFIRTELTPNERTENAEKIAFLQIARQGKKGGGWATKATDPFMTADRAKRTDSKTGWRVDRADPAGDKTPLYGLKKTGAGITDPYAHATIGKHGGTKPFMRDKPGIANFDRMEFFACAVCIEPKATAPAEKGRSYGCINWGYTFNGSAKDAATGWVEEDPTYSLQAAFGGQTGRAKDMESAVKIWNKNIATTGSGIDAADQPFSMAAKVKKGVAGGEVELRRIHDSGPDVGKIYASGDKLAEGTKLLVLRRTVNREDVGGTKIDMTEVLSGAKPGWLPAADLELTP